MPRSGCKLFGGETYKPSASPKASPKPKADPQVAALHKKIAALEKTAAASGKNVKSPPDPSADASAASPPTTLETDIAELDRLFKQAERYVKENPGVAWFVGNRDEAKAKLDAKRSEKNSNLSPALQLQRACEACTKHEKYVKRCGDALEAVFKKKKELQHVLHAAVEVAAVAKDVEVTRVDEAVVVVAAKDV